MSRPLTVTRDLMPSWTTPFSLGMLPWVAVETWTGTTTGWRWLALVWLALGALLAWEYAIERRTIRRRLAPLVAFAAPVLSTATRPGVRRVLVIAHRDGSRIAVSTRVVREEDT